MESRLAEIEERLLELERRDWGIRTALEANSTSAEEIRTYAECGLTRAAGAVRMSGFQPDRSDLTCVNREGDGDMAFVVTNGLRFTETDEYQMRKWALQSAIVFNELPEHTVERATSYLKFLKGESSSVDLPQTSQTSPAHQASEDTPSPPQSEAA